MSNRRKLKRRPGSPSSDWGAAGSMTEADQKKFRDTITRLQGEVHKTDPLSDEEGWAMTRLGVSLVMLGNVLKSGVLSFSPSTTRKLLGVLYGLADAGVDELRHQDPTAGGPRTGDELMASIPYTHDDVVTAVLPPNYRPAYASMAYLLILSTAPGEIKDSQLMEEYESLLRLGINGVCLGGSDVEALYLSSSDKTPYMGDSPNGTQ